VKTDPVSINLQGSTEEERLQIKPAPSASAEAAREADLITQAVSGSADAFSELFNFYYPMIHAFAYRLSLCPGEAADIAQDTFIQAARSLGGFRREASFKNWLYTIAANKGRDRHRSRARQQRLSQEWLALNQHADAAGESPEAVAVREALATLALDLREAVTLVYYEGLNHADAARILGCAETTVSWRIFRAKQKLKNQLRPRAAGGLLP
jgi:RNA polymerase sigma-70 factor, ECF subfamily